MYPVLILRSELVCLVILIFLFFTSRSYNIESGSKSFRRILRFALLHVVFDVITVLTVNHVDTIPTWVNWICHVLFYCSAIFFSNEIVNYVVAICYPQKARNLYAMGHFLTLIYICCLSFLKIDYVADVGTYSSAGPAAIVGYGLAFLFFISALVIMFTHLKMLPGAIRTALIPMMLVLIILEVCQMIWKSILFTGGAVTIVTVGFFFSLESPAAVFKKIAMTDSLTGVRSRSSYEADIEKYDRRFRGNPGDDYIFVLCDLNNLRRVNDRFGHLEGDSYITLITSAINRCMKHGTAVYRTGGDEFLILYYKTGTEIVEREIRALREACAKASEDLTYSANISIGYAQSSASYRTLRDVMKTADYAMYQDKIRVLSGSSPENGASGTKLNYAGLTDKIFDAMCASNDVSYPFITNLDTNVTRIAPEWKSYFGLDAEFYGDFNTIWAEHIHPDYYEGFTEDIAAVINGHQRYHNFDYLAKKADGEYVPVSCHGSIYRDTSNGTTFFTGFMINYGLSENVDPVTGLENFDRLTNRVSVHMDEQRPFSIMKLKINNFARVNMLYGYSVGNEVIRQIAAILTRELEGGGEVYCQNSVNFSILFESADQQTLDSYYQKISEICAAGLKTETVTVPVLISGGAITSNGDRQELERLRSGLVFALEESHYNQRNALVFYRDADNASADTNIPLLAEIHADALAEMNFFRLRYQPIVDVSSGKAVGAEALLRWIHPVYGEVSPNQFIAFLENDPCYYRLGLRILEQAVRDSKKLQAVIPEFKINVNITALQLQNEHFADHVFEILEKYDYAPDGLVLELTERCKEMDSSFLARKIAELRSRNMLVAFDDLGTGYSTISLLMDIPVDEIKLDKDFVQDIGNRETYQIFVKALVLGSSSYGYNICFEGIENTEMLQQISGIGNYLAQGYHFSKPLLFDDFKSYVDRQLASAPSV